MNASLNTHARRIDINFNGYMTAAEITGFLSDDLNSAIIEANTLVEYANGTDEELFQLCKMIRAEFAEAAMETNLYDGERSRRIAEMK